MCSVCLCREIDVLWASECLYESWCTPCVCVWKLVYSVCLCASWCAPNLSWDACELICRWKLTKLLEKLVFIGLVFCRYAAAELDCTECIIRDPSYVKAFSRRAAARFALARHNDALQDYKQVLVLEPSNRFAKSELERIKKVISWKTVDLMIRY